MKENTRTTTWYGFPSGWIPNRLVVRWDANSSFAVYFPETHGIVHGKVEYSLNGGGSWTILEQFVSTDLEPATNVPSHDAPPVNLSPSQDPTQVQVRGTFTVRFTTCNNCSAEVSNIGGQFYIRDIRIEVAPPTLTVTPDPVTRGQTVTFEVKDAPGGSISNWRYEAGASGTIWRATNLGSTTWPGVLVASGTAKVRVVLLGSTYNLEKQILVNPRSWHTAERTPPENAEGLSEMPSPPQPFSRLGISVWNFAYEFDATKLEQDGPNAGINYVTAVRHPEVATTYFKYQISADLESGTDFYNAQCGTNGFISGPVIRNNMYEHESGRIRGHYQQYVDQLNLPYTNFGEVAEGLLGATSQQLTAFTGFLHATLATKATDLEFIAAQEACNQFANIDTSCVNRGNVNYFPYVPCQ